MSGAAPAPVPILELDDVSAAYSTYRALFGVSLTVPADGIVALVGSNGAGKSTLARVATGLVPVSKGTIRIGGEDVTKLAAHRIARRGVTHVPEGRAVFSTLTVEENLTVSFLKRVGRRGVADALARAYDAFPVLAERRRQLGGTLSGGQQRILSLAKVLAVAPKLLVVDELSLGLAPVIVDQVYDGLVAIHQQGCAVLVVEQQVDRALAIADRAVLLVKGAVAWEGPARDAKPVLETQMLSGHATNGSSAIGNGAGPAPRTTTAFVPPTGAPSAPGPPPAPASGPAPSVATVPPGLAPPPPAAPPPPPAFAPPTVPPVPPPSRRAPGAPPSPGAPPAAPAARITPPTVPAPQWAPSTAPVFSPAPPPSAPAPVAPTGPGVPPARPRSPGPVFPGGPGPAAAGPPRPGSQPPSFTAGPPTPDGRPPTTTPGAPPAGPVLPAYDQRGHSNGQVPSNGQAPATGQVADGPPAPAPPVPSDLWVVRPSPPGTT